MLNREKSPCLCVTLLFLVSLVFINCGRQEDFSVLEGPYLGQTPPGAEPEIFAPGLISTHYSQSYIAFLNDARVCVYSAGTEKGHETYYTYEKNGHWTTPKRAPFEELQGHPNYTTGPHGRKVYFHSGRPTHSGDTRQDDNIWTIEWTGSGWAEPEVLPSPANSDYGEAYPSATADGTVYFFTWRRPDTRGDDIWVSRCIDGQYQEAERLPRPINTDFIEYDPYVAPDESFLIFGSSRPGGYGNSDNYICFRKEGGSWTHPINLGRPFNSSSWDLCANGTPDGKYFFFLSGRKTDVDKGHIGKKSGEEPVEDSDLYWVDFSFIDDLKNTVLTKQNAADIIKKDYEKYGVPSAIETLNELNSNQKDGTFFSPFELLSLCKNMLVEDKTGDADLFFSTLDEVLPKDFSIKEGYARICAMNGRVSKGLKILEELESEDLNFDLSDSLSGLGYLFTLYPDKTEDALSVLQFTVEKFPEDPFAYYSLARVYRQLGDLDSAIANCRKALEIRPSIGDVSQLLERLLKEQEEKKADIQKKESIPVLKGPYLGQKPPGMTPEIFAPGVFLEDKNWFNVVFSPDGNELYFVTDFDSNRSADIMWLKNVDGIWTDPEPVSFNSKFNDLNMCLSADGNKFFFRSKRPIPGSDIPSVERHYLWFTTRKKEGWSDPQLVEYSGFETITTAYQSITNDGTLYFATPGSASDLDIHRSRFVDGSYSLPENLGFPPNTEYSEADLCIARNESFIIASCWDRPDNNGESDLYISFHKNDGSWTKLINMGKPINNELNENCPMISPDGKYFFFLRYNPTIEKAVTYWVSAKIIEALKPDDFLALKGPYLGQKPPGMTPEIFAPGIISTEEKYELNSIFSLKGDEFYYEISTTTQEEKKEGKYFYVIMVSKQVNGIWTKPEMAPFSGKYSTMDMCFSPDENRLYFTSDRPFPWDSAAKNHLWYVDRLEEGWSEPEILGPPIYSPDSTQSQPSVAKDGTIYFRIDDDLYYSKNNNGVYSKPVNLGSAINSPYPESKPFISPDESFLLFVRYDMPESIDGGRGLYISYKREDGSWTPAKNTNINGSLPKLTPDGKYFFFSRGGDIYWVNAKIIEDLRPKDNAYSQDIHRAVSEGDLEKPGDTFLYSQSDISRKIQVNEDLTVEEIEENVIVATHRFPWAGNCLAVRVSPSELVLVDTPWELTGTDALLTFLRERFGRVHITAVNTHFHQDNLGGNEILLSRNIPVYGSDLTIRLLEEKGAALIQGTLKSLSDPKHKRYFDAYKNLNLKPPDHVFELKKGLTLHIGEEDIEIFYPGPAHTLDNIVVYFPMRKILFGGCMIRSLESTGISPPSDGDLDSWPQSAKNVLERFPEARIVIPGHGTWGDIRLIQHTIDIANQSLRQSDFPVLKGPYLGQKPPGMTPELFAPGIVPTEANEGLYGFFNDGALIFFDRTPADLEEWTPAVYRMELKDGKWTQPNASPYQGKPWYHYYTTAPEGEQVYFAWKGSLGDRTSSADLNIWRVWKTPSGWAEPRKLPSPVNSKDLDTYPKVTADGTLYFFSNREGGFGGHDIYRSPSIDGKHTTIENLGAPINTEFDELDPFIAPDESYLIFCSKALEGFGGFDLYVTFKKFDGTWTNPVNMGEGINTSAYDWVPYVTADSKYFFFNSTRSGSWDIYWVDAQIIDEMKPKELK